MSVFRRAREAPAPCSADCTPSGPRFSGAERVPPGPDPRLLFAPVLRACPLLTLAAAVAVMGAGCGGDDITVPKNDPTYRGAVLFYERCSGCHTLGPAAAQGSKPAREVSGGERTNGPNLNVRTETREDVLYAIRNGGFSGAIMPANIVVGRDADAVAAFVAKYAGGKTQEGPGPTRNPGGG
jgi:mono/diheme cytochrome c family protein